MNRKYAASLVHPTGNPNSRQVALALSEADCLREIVTTIAYNPNGYFSRILKLLPKKFQISFDYEFRRRAWVAPPGTFIRSHPLREITRLALVKSGLKDRLGLDYFGSADWLYYTLDQHVAKYHLLGIHAIYAYEDGAASTFQIAKKRGIVCFYDLPIAYYKLSQKIQAEEAQRFPDLAEYLKATREPSWKIERKDQEIKLADQIFVPSTFVKESLLETGVARKKIKVIPFGSPEIGRAHV